MVWVMAWLRYGLGYGLRVWVRVTFAVVSFAVLTSAVLTFAVESAVVYVVCMHVYYNNISCKIITDVGSYIEIVEFMYYDYICIWAYFKIVFSLRRDIFYDFLPITTFL